MSKESRETWHNLTNKNWKDDLYKKVFDGQESIRDDDFALFLDILKHHARIKDKK